MDRRALTRRGHVAGHDVRGLYRAAEPVGGVLVGHAAKVRPIPRSDVEDPRGSFHGLVGVVARDLEPEGRFPLLGILAMGRSFSGAYFVERRYLPEHRSGDNAFTPVKKSFFGRSLNFGADMGLTFVENLISRPLSHEDLKWAAFLDNQAEQITRRWGLFAPREREESRESERDQDLLPAVSHEVPGRGRPQRGKDTKNQE